MKQEDGETICELRQTMPMEDRSEQRHFLIECGKGWTFYMTNLKSMLGGGNWSAKQEHQHSKRNQRLSISTFVWTLGTSRLLLPVALSVLLGLINILRNHSLSVDSHILD
jgi:hypothetical protein